MNRIYIGNDFNKREYKEKEKLDWYNLREKVRVL
jgi:hypothetical protein